MIKPKKCILLMQFTNPEFSVTYIFRSLLTLTTYIYLVRQYNQSDDFDWARHEFQVIADVANGIYECECKLWTHTGQWGK